MPWNDLLSDASGERTLQRARGMIGKKIECRLGMGGTNPVAALTGSSDCSGSVAWAIGVPRELPPKSGRWLSTDRYWTGGGPVAEGLFTQVAAGQVRGIAPVQDGLGRLAGTRPALRVDLGANLQFRGIFGAST